MAMPAEALAQLAREWMHEVLTDPAREPQVEVNRDTFLSGGQAVVSYTMRYRGVRVAVAEIPEGRYTVSVAMNDADNCAYILDTGAMPLYATAVTAFHERHAADREAAEAVITADRTEARRVRTVE